MIDPVTGSSKHLAGGMANLPAGEGSRLIICQISKDFEHKKSSRYQAR